MELVPKVTDVNKSKKDQLFPKCCEHVDQKIKYSSEFF